MKFKKPFFWDLPKQSYLSYLLFPFSIPIIIKNFITRFFKKKKSSTIKTICVGNIYLGGTGKTPLTIKIYEILRSLNKKVATVKKYHSDQSDEQLLLKQKTSLLIVNSRKNALKPSLNYNYDTLIFDDGLQDMQIDYDIKIVCFKTKNWIGNGQLIPAGPMREKISSLKRFNAVILNGYSKNIDMIEEQIQNLNPNIKIFRTDYEIFNIQKYDINAKYLIFSGIGNPSDFKEILIKNKFNVIKEMIFPDHYQYNFNDLINIINNAKNEKLKILTTEKDFMRIPEEFKKKISFLSINLFIKNEKKFIDFLNK
tara:strand:+ start:3154 stop:4086 length:933 start_codon:yes stop_codon:yes gene_type:complete